MHTYEDSDRLRTLSFSSYYTTQHVFLMDDGLYQIYISL